MERANLIVVKRDGKTTYEGFPLDSKEFERKLKKEIANPENDLVGESRFTTFSKLRYPKTEIQKIAKTKKK